MIILWIFTTNLKTSIIGHPIYRVLRQIRATATLLVMCRRRVQCSPVIKFNWWFLMNTSKCGSSWHRLRYILGKWPYCGGRERLSLIGRWSRLNWDLWSKFIVSSPLWTTNTDPALVSFPRARSTAIKRCPLQRGPQQHLTIRLLWAIRIRRSQPNSTSSRLPLLGCLAPKIVSWRIKRT